jgi:glucose/arabinose dehydrogenase
VRLDRLNLPPGFAIAPFARVPGARTLLVAEDGARIYVAAGDSEVFAILDPERDGIANEVVAVAGGLEVPNGLALSEDGALLIVERHRILRLEASGGAKIMVPQGVLPDQSHHGWRYGGLGPDGKLYVAVGAPCNICAVKGFEGTIVRLRPDGHELEIFAEGVRNPAGFDWHPVTGEMFFTDHGGDLLGGPVPPDELNRAPAPGLHFGYPYVYGDGIPYPQFAAQNPPRPATPPALALEAQSAALGIDFYQGRMFPEDYRNDALVAEHGSGDRPKPVGYRIMRVRFSPAARPQGKWVFIDGWLGLDGSISGRPVDLEELPDGSLLISDDHAGLIYRVTYQP